MSDFIERQIESLRSRWPQSHIERPATESPDPRILVVVPSVLLPRGWNASIGTVLWFSSPLYATALDGFYMDIPDLRLAGGSYPHMTRTEHQWPAFSGHPQWRDLTRFWWKAQAWDANHSSLFTNMMLVRRRLALVQ